jgi:hypothetical protein
MTRISHARTSTTVAFILLAACALNLLQAVGNTPATHAAAPRTANVDDAAQALVRLWTGTWSGNSFGRNNPGQPQPSAPVAGNWILDLRIVDTANNTASGTLTWTGKDAFWTYELQSNGTTVATPHDFIPDRTIQFDNSNTTLISPAPGAGPQYRLTIEGFKNKPNPSDAFYGPFFNIDLFLSGVAASVGIGFTAHPYNTENFDTALSSGTVSGGTNVCTLGVSIPNVRLPEVTVNPLIPNKSWRIRYGELGLDFTTITPAANALCEVRSNTGSLNVLGAPRLSPASDLFGPFIVFAHSIASATLTTYKGAEAVGLPTCNFVPFSGPRNNCILNGAFNPNTYYAKWHTEGFTTEVNVLHLAGEPDFLSTGPLTFWVDLVPLKLSPAVVSMESIVRGVEPFLHRELIANLPLITKYAFIQDPGQVSLFVVKDGILGTGKSGTSATVTNIPRSLYYESDTNPAVILLEPDPGNYKIFVNGVASGDYALSVSTTTLPANTTEAANASGVITQGSSIVYDLNLNAISQGVTQLFNTAPIPFPPMQLVMVEPASQPSLAAALDSMLQTRDPFRLVNPANLLSRGSDLRTRLHLLVSYLRLSPGEGTSAVTAEAMDEANNIYTLEVEDVRDVPNTALSQVTVRLSESLPNGKILLRVGLHGKVTDWGAVAFQK